MGSLVNEISEDIDEFFMLVLDDYEKLDDSTVINAAMDFFLRYLPDNCRVAVCSRTLPKKLTLTRLAGEGQVLGVGQEHLRFRPPAGLRERSDLETFRAGFATRPSAQATPCQLDAPSVSTP